MAYKNGDITMYKTGSAEVLLSPFGRTYRPIPEERKKREDYAASGKYRKSFVCLKYRFEIPYTRISGTALQALLDLYDLNSELNLKVYTSASTWFLNAGGSIPVVIMEPIERQRLLLMSPGLWTGSKLTLIEV